MSTLVWKELRHHARQWLWSLLVATVGGTVISLIITTWWSASQWAGAQPENAFLILAAHLIGSNLVTYVGLATTVVISTTLALTVAAQQRSHALWKVIGIPGPRIRSIILRQVSVVGVTGGLIGGLLALPATRLYLTTWREMRMFPEELPLSMPAFGVPLTVLITTLFCLLGGLGGARRAASTPEMQALREAGTPTSRTRLWQWIVAGVLLIGVVVIPIMLIIAHVNPSVLLENTAPGTPTMTMEELQSPGFRITMGGAVGMIAAMAALCLPNLTLRPLLMAWTRLIPGRSPAWFAARANAWHRSTMSMTTITPFAIAVAMTGTVYSIVGAGQANGATGSVNGFLPLAVPIFIISGVGGVANIAMVGRARRQEGALLGVIGARSGTILSSTVLEGAIYAVTGILFGLIMTLITAVAMTAISGQPSTFLASIPLAGLLPVVGASLVLAIATTWLPAQLDRRPLMENLRQPV